MSQPSNNERIKLVADALAELNSEVIYVGGAVVQLYSSDAASANPSTTYDVDCVVNLTTYREYREFEKKLYAKRFCNDTSEDAPICRYLVSGEKVDFMPMVDTGIGESNRWYLKGMEFRQSHRLDPETTIYIMPAPYYLASKLEALHSRGGQDYRGEKDFEDILFVLNTCTRLPDEVMASPDIEVRNFLASEFSDLLKRPNIREEIDCALSEDGRSGIVLERMEAIASE